VTPVTTEQIVDSLHQLGFSVYEARLYLGLLTGGPQNGNELSRTSGVPSSKVYAMLERLAAEGLVARSQRKNTVEYVCVPPHDLLYKLRERYSKPLAYLEETLPTLEVATPDPDILQLQGIEAIIDNARAIVRAARHELYLSIWEEFAELFVSDLEDADARGVRIAGMLYGGDTPSVGWWQLHSYRETVASRIGGRMLTLVGDGGDALIAHVPDRGEASAVRTTSPVLTLVAEEYLIHDLTLQKAKTMTGYAEWDKQLRSDEELKKLTLGRTGRLSPIEPTGKKRPRARAGA
jgi:HTH-type transcriptional regulator, sugar sensing transcriptional regulator